MGSVPVASIRLQQHKSDELPIGTPVWLSGRVHVEQGMVANSSKVSSDAGTDYCLINLRAKGDVFL